MLPTPEREACERQANSAKEKYYAELADYKKTPQYESYQKYLEDFKAKHAVPTKGRSPPHITTRRNRLTLSEGKRSKLETETSTSTRSSSHDQHERSVARRFSGQLDPTPAGYSVSEYSPPVGSGRPASGPGMHSKPTSPSMSGLSSPRTGGYYPVVSASPRSAHLSKESSFEYPVSNLVRDPRLPSDTALPYPISTFSHSARLSSSTSPIHPSGSQYHSALDLPTRRPVRDATARLPPLTHEDTTWSSESGHSGHSLPHSNYPGPTLPIDPSKTMRVLPHPIPTFGPSTSPLDRPAQMPMSQIPLQDYRTQGPLAALVRAGELAARVADDEPMADEVSP